MHIFNFDDKEIRYHPRGFTSGGKYDLGLSYTCFMKQETLALPNLSYIQVSGFDIISPEQLEPRTR